MGQVQDKRTSGAPAAAEPTTSDDQAIARVVDDTRLAELELVRFLYVDHGGIVRGKATSAATLADRMSTGIGLTVAMQAMNMLDQLQPVAGMGPVGEIRLVPDAATFVNLPYAPGAGAMLCDMRTLDGAPWAACARSFLKAAIDDAALDGSALVAAYEPEFTLATRERDATGDERLVPVDESLCFSTTGFDAAHDFTIDFVRALNAQGLTVEQYYPELGHGQQELSIRHADVLAAADRHVLYRETARGVALRHGLWASLAPKPIADQAGNGAHLHLSLWDAGAGSPARESPAQPRRNLFFNASDRLGLSDTAYHFMAGLLAHMPALLALTCASVNSFRRLAPMHWSSAYTCYGMDNREAAVRIASPMWGGAEQSTNIELKASDSSANPYLALGGVLISGLDGVRRQLDPGEPTDVDPDTLSEAQRRRRGIKRFPTSLAAALDELERDELLMDALGPLRSQAYLAVKRSEVAAFGARDTEFECLAHALRI